MAAPINNNFLSISSHRSHRIDLKESKVALKTALNALETTRATLFSEITNLEKKYSLNDSQSTLKLMSDAISKKEEIASLKKTVSFDEIELNDFLAGLDEITEKKNVIDKYILKFNQIKDSSFDFSELLFEDSSKIEKIKRELPKEYHAQTLEEIDSILSEDLDSVLEVIADLKSKCNDLKRGISENKQRINILEKSISEDYESGSLADLKERKRKLERKLKFSSLRNEINAQADQKLRKLKLDLFGTDCEIREKRDELNKIDRELRDLKHLQHLRVEEPLNVNSSDKIADIDDLSINESDEVNSNVENKSLTKWELFKDFILGFINAIRNLFRSPYSA